MILTLEESDPAFVNCLNAEDEKIRKGQREISGKINLQINIIYLFTH